MDSIVVRQFDEKYLDQIVQIHLDGLGYTLNSLLGSDHLAFMYRTMALSREAYVGIAFDRDQPVGVISGTLDMDATKSVLLRTFKFSQWVHIAVEMATHPRFIYEWWKGNIISRPVNFEGVTVKPLLATIVVDIGYHGKGVGKCLINALEDFLTTRNIRYYRLDTLTANHGAREFYKRLGFQEFESRVDSVVFVKKITP